MIKVYVVIFLFYLLLNDSLAQEPLQNIRGQIIDIDTKSPIIGATIMLLYQSEITGTVSDVEGNFRLEKLSLGRHTLEISFLGYEKKIIPNILLTSGKEVVLTIELSEAITTMQEIVVTANKDKSGANNELVSVSARNFKSEETNRFAGSRFDPARMVSNYAGVVSGNDTRNDIIVRGNSPHGILWRLEDFDIPNPNHFSSQGATGGAISILNNNMLANSDFLTGAFPAEYANKMAGVFDLKMRTGNNDHKEWIGQMGINGLEFGAEGPFKKTLPYSYNINLRYTDFTVFDLLGINFGVSGIPTYQDGSFKLNFPTKKIGNISVFGIAGVSNISILSETKDSASWTFTDDKNDLILTSGMRFVGINHSYSFNNKAYSKFGVSISDSKLNIRTDTTNPINQEKFTTYSDNSTDGSIGVNYLLTYKFNAKNLIKTGVRYKHIFFDYSERFFHDSLLFYVYSLDEKGNTDLAQGFIHWQYRISQKITFNSGIIAQNFFLNNSLVVEPRVGIKYAINPIQTIGFAYGKHSQTQPTVMYFLKTYDPDQNLYLQTNKDLDFSKAHHFVLNYNYNFAQNWRFKTETYYQYLYDIPVQGNQSTSFSMINFGSGFGVPNIDSLVNSGTGQNYGVELTLERFLSKGYYFLITSSLYKSTYKGSDGIERHTAFDGRYVCNMLVGTEQLINKKKKHYLAVDGKVILAGGNRYTPIDIASSIQEGQQVNLNSEAFSKQFDGYSRVDVKLSYIMNFSKATHSFFATVENVFNKKNPLWNVFNASKGIVTTDYQLGLFPYGGYRVQF